MRFPIAPAVVLALLFAARGPASAADVSVAQRAAIDTATTAYFAALGSADLDAMEAAVTPTYRMIDTHGAVLGVADVIGAAARVSLAGSKPQGNLTIGVPAASNDGVTETASSQTYTYSFVAGRNALVRRFSSHDLTLTAGADGAWRVATDRVTADHTYY